MERWTLRAALSRFIDVAREDGARPLWFKVWGELCYRRLALFELALDAPVPQPASRIPVAVAPVADGEAERYAALNPCSDDAQFGPRLAAGHSYFLARSGGEPVGSCWVARGALWSDYLGIRIEMADDEACTYETYTAPHARGRGIGPAMRAEIARDLRDAGDRRLLATVHPENAAAIRLVEKLGYRRIGTIGYFGVGRRRKGFCRMRAGESPPGTAPLSAAPRSLPPTPETRASRGRPLRWWSGSRARH